MSLITKLALPGLLFACVAQLSAQPLIRLSDNAEISVQLTGAAQYNDNVFLDAEDQVSDVLLILSPGIVFNYGEPGQTNLNITYVHDIVTYVDNDDQNRDNPNFSLTGSFASPKSDLSYSATYQDITQNSATNNLLSELADRTEIEARVRGEWEMSVKSSAAVGANYLDVNYSNPALFDREEYALPLNYYWEYTPKLDLSVGYRYRESSYSRSAYTDIVDGLLIIVPAGELPDRTDHFFNLGVRGELGAKTSGEVRVGYQNRDFGGTSGSKGQFSVDASVDWEASPKMLYTVKASRDFRSASTGASYTTTDMQVIGQYAIDAEWSSYASLKYMDDSYDGGISNQSFYGQLGVRYTPNLYSSFVLAYTLYDNSSSAADSGFTSNIFNLSATLRY